MAESRPVQDRVRGAGAAPRDRLFMKVVPVALSEIDRSLLDRCLSRKARAWEDFVDRFMGLVVHVINHTAQCRSINLSAADRYGTVGSQPTGRTAVVGKGLVEWYYTRPGSMGRTVLLTLSRWRHGFESRTGCQGHQIRGPLRRVADRCRANPPMPCRSSDRRMWWWASCGGGAEPR